MMHKIDVSKPAKLIRGDLVSQFGEGYRQVSGPTIAEGSVAELLERAQLIPHNERSKYYIYSEDVSPRTIEEVERQMENGK